VWRVVCLTESGVRVTQMMIDETLKYSNLRFEEYLLCGPDATDQLGQSDVLRVELVHTNQDSRSGEA